MTERELLIWLNHNSTSTHTTKSIASYFGVTTRTVQNYLRAIKDEYQESIEISRKGIRVKKPIPLEAAGEIPSTYKERKRYILRKLLINGASVDMDWLADRLCISEITLQNEIKRIRKSLEAFRLALRTKNNRLFIDGDIKDKKSLMIREIYEEAQKSMVSLDTLSDIFFRYPVKEIRRMILEKLHAEQLFMDEYSLINLLLHILIAMDQSSLAPDLAMAAENGSGARTAPSCIAVMEEICKKLEETYCLKFTSDSRYQFGLLLMTRAIHNKRERYPDSPKLPIHTENWQLVQEILEQVFRVYNIDLNNREFVVAFSLHIQNMLIRLKEQIRLHNPLLNHIKITSPFIYDIGVYISTIIKQRCHVDIYEDEIAYIALHVGACIEEINRTKGKLKAVLVCPQYYSYPNRQFERMYACFQDEIVLENVVTNPAEILQTEADLIISTVPMAVSCECVLISNFFYPADQEAIAARIRKIKQEQMRERIASLLPRMIRAELFESGVFYSSKEDAIRKMGERMIRCGLVSGEFIEKIREREQISPSDFGGIAIPHPIDYYTNESAIGVSLLANPVDWGNSEVKILFMLAVSRQDLALYPEVFSFLAGVCAGRGNLERLAACRRYDAFMEQLVRLDWEKG